jgi:uncharacterized metal-binding protein YceD (DUF177 family)
MTTRNDDAQIPAAPEFSRPIDASTVSSKETVRTIEATPAERRALAERLDLEALDGLAATLRLRRVRGEMVRVSGTIAADVVQTCVVTLDPVPNHVEESFEELFAPPHLVPEMDEDSIMDFLSDDIPEPFENGRIDLGEVVAQHLSLALDPFPRAPGVEPLEIIEADDETEERDAAAGGTGEAEEGRPNPFAALAKLKSRH